MCTQNISLKNQVHNQKENKAIGKRQLKCQPLTNWNNYPNYKKYKNPQSIQNQLCQTSLWTEDLSKEIGLETAPLQLEHVATNQGRNHHSTHLGQKSVAGRQARLF